VIVCVCLSPAVDITYRVGQLTAGATNRVRSAARRPGGKAVNVARVLHVLGEPVSLLAPVGGRAGVEFAEDLGALGVPATLVTNGASTRSTVTVVDDAGVATTFVEPAPLDCWPGLLAHAQAAVARADVLVVSGMVPTGAPAGALGELVRQASGAGRASVVDTSGLALLDALRAQPTMIKPNADELAEVTGERDAARAAGSLARRYDTTVVASLGPEGVLVATPTDEWRAWPASKLTGNPTGAGDALVAGLARGLRGGTNFEQLLGDAVGLAAAAVLSPHAGEVDPAVYAEQRAGVRVEATGARR
jgi:tagatose 6-phosphate kinase